MPGARCTHSPACEVGSAHGSSPQVHRDHPAFPHAMVLTACFVLSPVTGLVCHRRQRIWRAKTRLGRHASANLTPASGRQDHTTSPSAAIVSRQRTLRLLTSPFGPALRSPRAQNAAASTASRSASVTIAIRPSVGGMARVLEVIWVRREWKYFCKWGWTDKSPESPSGKSVP